METFATVFAIAPSYHDPEVLWVGSDDGYVHVTRDGGGDLGGTSPHPTRRTLFGSTPMEPSPTSPGKAYVAGIRYLVEDDRSPYVWKTTDFGATWTKIVTGIPEDDFVRAVREDPERAVFSTPLRSDGLYLLGRRGLAVTGPEAAHGPGRRSGRQRG